MKTLILSGLLFMSIGAMAQNSATTWSRSNPPVDTMQADSNVLHIISKLHEMAHQKRDPRVIYDEKQLDPFACYRSFINRASGTRFWILVSCEELKNN